MVGFLLSVEHGLFGFKDSWVAPFAHEAFFVDVATITVLFLAGALCIVGPARSPSTRSTPAATSSHASSPTS
jgi:hypothetical protein